MSADYYYQTFDSVGKDRSSLGPLYVSMKNAGVDASIASSLYLTFQRENSMLSWEGEQIMGQTAIIAKLNVSENDPAA